MPAFKTNIDLHSDDYQRNAERMSTLVGDLQEKMNNTSIGGSEEARKKHIKRGKLLPRERVNLLLDSGSPFLEFSQLAAHEMYDDDVPAAGIITGIGRVSGKEVVIVANDATKNICVHRKSPWKITCLVYISSIQEERFFQCRIRFSRTGNILAAYSITRPKCLQQE